VVHGVPLARAVEIVAVFVAGLKLPESTALMVVVPDTVVTFAELAKMRHTFPEGGVVVAGAVVPPVLVLIPDGPEGFDDLPEQAIAAIVTARRSVRTGRTMN
jgi:hypothetical protein